MNDEIKYCILNFSDLSLVNFDEVFETNSGTIRVSIDGLLFVIKYKNEPTFIQNGSVIPVQILTHLEALELMKTPNWSGQE